MKDDVIRTTTLSGIMDKDSDILWGIGSVDEANAFIGLAKVFSRNEEVRKILEEIQLVIFEA
ncbi:MAG TPA: ATP:cob(I)alamin adenosyltransferase, partial [Archaeoglobaceae archaeon]|nr:ATP:cob(I)alamin adenosyltransferase [Archaeoglobaceae archaeon]